MTFTEIEAEYRRLKAQHDAGTLSEADFKAQLQNLMAEDEQGRWWIIGYETGRWYFHDGERWSPGEPPRPAPEAPPKVKVEPTPPIVQTPQLEAYQPIPAPERDKRRVWPWVAGIIGVVLMLLLIRQTGRVRSIPTAEPAPARPPAATEVIEPQASPAGVVTSVVAPSCDYGGELKAIEALDDFTVRFTLCYPDAGFAAKVALPPFGIHPAEYLAATGGTGKLLEAPIGTGPYRLASWGQGELRLEVNLEYWGGPAKVPYLQFHWLDDANVRLGHLKVGDVDGIDNPPPETYAEIQSNADLALYPRMNLDTGYLGISTEVKPFDDVRVRQAVAWAIDRAYLVSTFYPPGTFIATHFTPCTISNGCGGESWYDFDPERARMLLAEAGYPDGFETQLVYRDVFRSYLPDPVRTAQAIAEMLAKYLNIRVELTAVDSAEFLDATGAGKLPLYLLGWSADSPDPAGSLNPYWGEFSGERFKAGFGDIWALLDQAATTSDLVVRTELYAQANDLIKRDVPLVPLVHSGSATAFRANVAGAHSSPLHLESFAAMALPDVQSTLVWKQATGPQSLYCADETEIDTWRACAQINESLLAFRPGSTDVTIGLAEGFEASDDATVWTFYLRKGVKFHDGSLLDASDVVTSWAVIWDAANPLHRGRTGAFDHFLWLFNGFLNVGR